jgi:hypothetical protein
VSENIGAKIVQFIGAMIWEGWGIFLFGIGCFFLLSAFYGLVDKLKKEK